MSANVENVEIPSREQIAEAVECFLDREQAESRLYDLLNALPERRVIVERDGKTLVIESSYEKGAVYCREAKDLRNGT